MIHHTVVGSGPPVVLLHGGTGSSETYWAGQIEGLSELFTLILMDHRGFGKSDAGEFSIEGCAEDVVALLDQLDLRRADIVGLSLGGVVAMQTALLAPERVRRLVLSDTFSSVRTQRFRRFIDHVLIASLREGGHDLMYNLNLIFAHGEDYLSEHRDMLSAGMAQWRNTDIEQYVASLTAIRDWDADDQLDKITAPSLVVWGSDDIEVPRQYAERLAEAIPNAVLTVIQGAGHKCCVEKPGQFNKLVRTFLAN